MKEFSALKDIKLGAWKPFLLSSLLADIYPGLSGRHQLSNASLAVELARTFLVKKNGSSYPDPIPGDFVAGLENTKWPGRCQVILDPNYSSTTWYLDGAHTEESLKYCIEWFVSSNVSISEQVLVIQCDVLSNDTV